jgi:hypothetical protein
MFSVLSCQPLKFSSCAVTMVNVKLKHIQLTFISVLSVQQPKNTGPHSDEKSKEIMLTLPVLEPSL